MCDNMGSEKNQPPSPKKRMGQFFSFELPKGVRIFDVLFNLKLFLHSQSMYVTCLIRYETRQTPNKKDIIAVSSEVTVHKHLC